MCVRQVRRRRSARSRRGRQPPPDQPWPARSRLVAAGRFKWRQSRAYLVLRAAARRSSRGLAVPPCDPRTGDRCRPAPSTHATHTSARGGDGVGDRYARTTTFGGRHVGTSLGRPGGKTAAATQRHRCRRRQGRRGRRRWRPHRCARSTRTLARSRHTQAVTQAARVGYGERSSRQSAPVLDDELEEDHSGGKTAAGQPRDTGRRPAAARASCSRRTGPSGAKSAPW